MGGIFSWMKPKEVAPTPRRKEAKKKEETPKEKPPRRRVGRTLDSVAKAASIEEKYLTTLLLAVQREERRLQTLKTMGSPLTTRVVEKRLVTLRERIRKTTARKVLLDAKADDLRDKAVLRAHAMTVGVVKSAITELDALQKSLKPSK